MPAPEQHSDPVDSTMTELKLLVPPDLYRAFQRCVWIRINQTGTTQLALMEEVIHDFLVKHGC